MSDAGDNSTTQANPTFASRMNRTRSRGGSVGAKMSKAISWFDSHQKVVNAYVVFLLVVLAAYTSMLMLLHIARATIVNSIFGGNTNSDIRLAIPV